MQRRFLVRVDFIKFSHYYRSDPTINPTRIVPIGPELDYLEPTAAPL